MIPYSAYKFNSYISFSTGRNIGAYYFYIYKRVGEEIRRKIVNKAKAPDIKSNNFILV